MHTHTHIHTRTTNHRACVWTRSVGGSETLPLQLTRKPRVSHVLVHTSERTQLRTLLHINTRRDSAIRRRRLMARTLKSTGACSRPVLTHKHTWLRLEKVMKGNHSEMKIKQPTYSTQRRSHVRRTTKSSFRLDSARVCTRIHTHTHSRRPTTCTHM